MGRDEKIFFITVAVAFGILWATKPKLNSSSTSSGSILDGKYKEPSVAASGDSQLKEDAAVAMQAMKDAINNKESKSELNKLNTMIFQDYKVKIMINKKTGKLRAMSKDGKVVAEEQ